MKKRIIFVIMLVLCTSLCACSKTSNKSEVIQSAVNEANAALSSGNYDAALGYYQLALNEGSKNADIPEIIGIINTVKSAKTALDNGDLDGAKSYVDSIPASYEKYIISGAVNELKSTIESKKSDVDNIENQIQGVERLFAQGDYEGVAINLNELLGKENLTQAQKERVNTIKQQLETANSKINTEKNKKPEVVYVAPNPPSGNTNVVATYYVVNCKEFITLRSAPSTSASEIVKMPLGKAVGYIENAGNGFYKVNCDGKVGYALAQYLSSSKESSNSSNYSASSSTTARVVNAKEFITLRATPSTSADEITKIPAGAYVTYLGTASNGFYYIEYNGMRGYGLQSYLQIQ